MKDSPIWKDAKHLHVCWRHQSAVYVTRQTSLRNFLPQKLVNNEYIRLTGDRAVEGKAGDAGNDGDAGSGDEGRKKTPNLSWMLKSCL